MKVSEAIGAGDIHRGAGSLMQGFGAEIWKRKDHLENTRRILLKEILKNFFGMAWTGLIWLRIGTRGGPLWMR
jgi:hypothetical protein